MAELYCFRLVRLSICAGKRLVHYEVMQSLLVMIAWCYGVKMAILGKLPEVCNGHEPLGTSGRPYVRPLLWALPLSHVSLDFFQT